MRQTWFVAHALVVGTLAIALDARPAAGQPAGTVECAADPGEREQCRADTSSGVSLLESRGDAACTLGRTWGFDANGVWVADGCHGEFAVAGYMPPVVSCASNAADREHCDADTSHGVVLVKTIGASACLQGSTWGQDEDGIWVSAGCSGQFALSNEPLVSCSSSPGSKREVCAATTAAGVTRVSTAGTGSCVLGTTWGYDAQGVWVTDGCGGEFLQGNDSPPAPSADSVFGRFEPYGRFLVHAAYYNDDVELQDNASWLGLRFSTRGAVKAFAATEWGVNLLQNDVEFNAGATTSSGFLTFDAADRTQVFNARLGYVGVDFGWAGRITFGKQLAVHYDVASYTTDQLNVFGGQASLAYPAESDGGQTGTGRTDKTLSYRARLLRILDVGGQVQFRTTLNDKFYDGLGASAQLTLLPGVKVGAAYTRTFVDDRLKGAVRGLDGNPEYAIVGARIQWPVLTLGAVYARQKNGDLRRVPLSGLGEIETVVFDGKGVELFGRLSLPGAAIYGGYNHYDPETNDPLFDPDFRIKYWVAGAEATVAGNCYVYAEARFADDSVGPTRGEQGFTVLTLGVHYGFSFKGFHRP